MCAHDDDMPPATPDRKVRGEQRHGRGRRCCRSDALRRHSLAVQGSEETADAHDTGVSVAEPLSRGEQGENGVDVVPAGSVARERGAAQTLRPGEAIAIGYCRGPHLPQHLTGCRARIGAVAHLREHTPQ